jgi:hypothetical protein
MPVTISRSVGSGRACPTASPLVSADATMVTTVAVHFVKFNLDPCGMTVLLVVSR